MEGQQTVETIDLKTFIKGQASLKGMSLTKIADRMGKRQSTLSGMLIRKTMSVGTLVEILDVLGEDLIVNLKNGNSYKIQL